MGRLLGRIRDQIGIYGSGFASESVLGLLLPVAIVLLIGGLGAVLVLIN